eukprot:PhF_6_TR21718/c0_g1_i1/m.31030
MRRTLSRLCTSKISTIVRSLVPNPDKEEIMTFLTKVQTTEDLVNAISMINHTVTTSAFGGDSTTERSDLFQRLAEAAYQCRDFVHMWSLLCRFREQGMVLIRPHAYSVLNALRRHMEALFEKEGRNPDIIRGVYKYLRQFLDFCEEDGMLLDYMMWTRFLVLMLHLLSLFDRQLLYREKWNYALMKKRDGLFVDFVITHERTADYDFAVQETMKFFHEILAKVRKHVPTRPSFAFMYRAAEIMFACDDYSGMLSVLEDMKSMGMFTSEALTARLLQLSTSFNIPESNRIFMEWRVFHDNSKLNSMDFFRVLSYYARAGGGRPCPKCGEPYNHRNVSIECWKNTPESQRNCEYLQLARTSKGIYNDLRDIPQNADWSNEALGLLTMATELGVTLGGGEWRLFLLCCTFSPRVFEAYEVFLRNYPTKQWDDIVTATVFRLHRMNNPSQIMPLFRAVRAEGKFIHGVVAGEALMGVTAMPSSPTRESDLDELVTFMHTTNTPPQTIPMSVTQANFEKWEKEKLLSEKEKEIWIDLQEWSSKVSAKLKPSFWEALPGTSKRHKTYPV